MNSFVNILSALKGLLDYGAVFISLASLVLTAFAIWVAYKYLKNKIIVDYKTMHGLIAKIKK